MSGVEGDGLKERTPIADLSETMSDDEYNSLKLTGLPIYDETEEKKCRTLDAPGLPHS